MTTAKEKAEAEATEAALDALAARNDMQREIAFSVFLPHYLERAGDVRKNTIEALEAAKVAMETADEYFAPETESEPESNDGGGGGGGGGGE